MCLWDLSGTLLLINSCAGAVGLDAPWAVAADRLLLSSTPLALITRVSIGLFEHPLTDQFLRRSCGAGRPWAVAADRLLLSTHSSGPHNTCVYDLKRVIVTLAVYPLTDQLLRRSCGAGRPWAVAADRLLPSSTPLALINTCVYRTFEPPLTDQFLRRSCGAGRPWAVAADRLLLSTTPLALITRVSMTLRES